MARHKLLKKQKGWFICRDTRGINRDIWFCRNDAFQAPEVCRGWGIPQYILNTVTMRGL